MYNRKFDIRKDFSAINEWENKIRPIVNNMENKEESEILENYIIKIFFNQYKQ